MRKISSFGPIHVLKYRFIVAVVLLLYFKENISANVSAYSSTFYFFEKCVVYIALARKVCKSTIFMSFAAGI
jgi:hypothetical protein